jgi:glycosyltransferase involved in cell wall biosynthesis
MKLFGNIYSDIRLFDGLPVGFFWQSLPFAIDYMSGIFVDNSNVILRAKSNFGFTPEQVSKHFVVRTPILGVNGTEATAQLRKFKAGAGKHSLWMSRISIEKRLELLREITERCSDRLFSMYGATLKASAPVNLSWVRYRPNVRLCGAFAKLADLPIDQFDSFVFTSSAEGMPIALLEAAMLGLPIVAPAVGGIGEFIDADTGWLVPANPTADDYARALDEIRGNPKEAARRVAGAQDRLIERHSWEGYCRRIGGIPGYLKPAEDDCGGW